MGGAEMTLKEIKNLSEKDFAKRYPFLQCRSWEPETRTYSLRFWSKEDGSIYHNVGDPIMQFYKDDFQGWNTLILCWAEKVREIALEKGILNAFWVSDIKEKYGSLRIYFNYSSSEINDLTYMAEHLSYYICYYCGHIGRSSNEKKLITYRSRGYWISYMCKQCAKKETWTNIKKYGINTEYLKKCLNSNPRLNMYKSIFDTAYERETGDWYSRITSYYKGEENKRLLDCHKLFEGMV